MFRPRVIPVLLLMGNSLVKTVRFSKKKPVYIGDPINAVRIFNDHEADELIILDITASKKRKVFPNDLVKKIGDEAFMPFSVGGGIQTIDEIRNILKCGAEKVIINTAAVKNPELIRQSSLCFGSQSIVVSVDVKTNMFGRERVVINGGSTLTRLDPLEHSQNMEALGAGEIFINFIDYDGRMSGYNYDYIQKITKSVNIPVIACGGAGKQSHLSDVFSIGGANAAAAGSLFVFHGNRKAVLINYPDRQELQKIFLKNDKRRE